VSILVIPVYKNSYSTIEKYEIILPVKKNCILINNTIMIAFRNKTTVISLLDFVKGFIIKQEENELIIAATNNKKNIFQIKLSYDFDIEFVNKTVVIEEKTKKNTEFIEFVAIYKIKENYKPFIKLLIVFK